MYNWKKYFSDERNHQTIFDVMSYLFIFWNIIWILFLLYFQKSFWVCSRFFFRSILSREFKYCSYCCSLKIYLTEEIFCWLCFSIFSFNCFKEQYPCKWVVSLRLIFLHKCREGSFFINHILVHNSIQIMCITYSVNNNKIYVLLLK